MLLLLRLYSMVIPKVERAGQVAATLGHRVALALPCFTGSNTCKVAVQWETTQAVQQLYQVAQFAAAAGGWNGSGDPIPPGQATQVGSTLGSCVAQECRGERAVQDVELARRRL